MCVDAAIKEKQERDEEKERKKRDRFKSMVCHAKERSGFFNNLVIYTIGRKEDCCIP